MSNCVARINNQDNWIIDSGAISHMCVKLSCFTHYTAKKLARTVLLPDGTLQNIKNIGLVCFNERFSIENVLHVPTFKFNLLLVGQLLQDAKIAIYFQPTHCILQGQKTKEPIVVGFMEHGLYQLNKRSFDSIELAKYVDNEFLASLTAVVKGQNENMIWHLHLGHVCWEKLKHVPMIKRKKILQPCHICPLSKQHRIVFPVTTSYEKETLALLHMDMWGPYHKASISGAKFILIVVDDYSEALWTVLLQSKSQAPSVIRQIIKKLEKYFGKSVRKKGQIMVNLSRVFL